MQSSKTTKHVDYKALEEGKLWIIQRDGQRVNASTDPASFDRAISEYINLFNRDTWPMSQRALLLTMAYTTIPMQIQEDTNQEVNRTHD